MTTHFNAAFGGQYGCYTDLSTGLSLLGRRYYATYNGRFINRDPTGTHGGSNLYGFCGNNPITNADPSGHYDFTAGG